MTAYFVTDESGEYVRDKDGVEFVEWPDITAFNFERFAYRGRQAAEGTVDHFDPEGRAGLQVAERDVELNIA